MNFFVFIALTWLIGLPTAVLHGMQNNRTIKLDNGSYLTKIESATVVSYKWESYLKSGTWVTTATFDKSSQKYCVIETGPDDHRKEYKGGDKQINFEYLQKMYNDGNHV